MNAATAAVRRLGRDMVVFAGASAGTLFVGLAIAATMTRGLGVATYGQLALLLLISSSLTVLLNLASLHGTFRLVFGIHGDDEGGAPGDDEPDTSAIANADAQRAAFGTSIFTTLVVGFVVVAALTPVAPAISQALLGTRHDSTLVLLAAASAVPAAGWRLVTNVLRYDRRPGAYAVSHIVRPTAILGIVIILFAASVSPLTAAIESYLLGGVVALIVAMVLARKEFRFVFVPRYVTEIYKLGASIAPVALAFFLMQSADVLLLSVYASDSQVGVYRLAGSLATPASYAVAAFLLAWSPLMRSPLQVALTREQGPREASKMLSLYFVICAGWMVIVITGLAGALTRIAPHSYRGAAALLPLLTLVPVARGWLVLVYRVCEFPTRRGTFIVSAVIGGCLWIGLSLVLIPPLGSYGAALAPVLGFLSGSLIIIVRSHARGSPAPLAWLRISVVAGVCALLVVAEQRVVGSRFDAAALVEAVAFWVAFPLILSVLRVIPATHRREIARIVRATLGIRGERSAEVARLNSLDPRQANDLKRFLRPRSVAERGLEPSRAQCLANALATVAGTDAPPADQAARVMQYVSRRLPVAERDRLGSSLVRTGGVDPLALERLSEAAGRLAHMRDRRWPLILTPPAQPPEVPEFSQVAQT